LIAPRSFAVRWCIVLASCTGWPIASASAQQPEDHAAAHHQHSSGDGSAPVEESGTAWAPAVSSSHGWHTRRQAWDLALHGNVFLQFISESGSEHHRGRQAGSINWMMVMASRSLSAGRLTLRSMVSAEPWTVRGCGYPNLLATGEVCDGDSIHDRQHPHDLFMELTATYDRPLTRGVRWEVYGGPAGEPALGLPGFPHRLSAMANPIAPIAHHWLDSTHVSFGVVTTGVYASRWKLEASAFNGREPDADRTDIDLAPLDSFSARLSIAPTTHLVVQASAGRLREAEEGIGTLPRSDVTRVTASGAYYRSLSTRRTWATTVAMGINAGDEFTPAGVFAATTGAGLIESTLAVNGTHTYFGRLEFAQKPADDLHAHEYGVQVFTVAKVQGGYTYSFRPWNGFRSSVGVTASASFVPHELAARYEGRIAPGVGVFVNLQPSGRATDALEAEAARLNRMR
jgi:hypothetical protein